MMSKIYVSRVKYFCYMKCLSYIHTSCYIRLPYHIYCISFSLCILILNIISIIFCQFYTFIQLYPQPFLIEGFYFGSVYDLYNRCVRFIRLLYNNSISIQYILTKKSKKKQYKSNNFYNSILEVTDEYKLNNSPLINSTIFI